MKLGNRNPVIALLASGLFFVFAATVCAQESDPLPADLPGHTRWNEVSSVRLDVEFPGDGYHASWLLHRCDCGDLLVESELNLPGEIEKGELLLVGQRAVLERGFKSKEFESAMSWDAPALMMQLALQLLERTVPDGPSSVNQRTLVSVREEETGIVLDSGNAVGGFPAPWTVNGMAEPLKETQRRFDLRFSFSVPGGVEMQNMRLTGVGDYSKQAFPLPEDMPLDDWKVTWRDSEDPASGEGKFETLADLRNRISARPNQGPSVPN